LSKIGPDGSSARDNLEQVKRQTGITPEELIGPKFPSLMSNVWSAFKSLSNRRPPSPSGVGPITYEQILAWKQLTETPITPRQIEVLELLDNKYVSIMNE
tara:strand:- start:406 stop:705 length:300 start_codon:yes stop_codon:yes gene_type:complete